MASATSVSIDATRLSSLALEIASSSTSSPILWDESSWHYTSDGSAEGDARTAMYVFALDALNFCFWPSEGGVLQYHHIATALKEVALMPDEEGGFALSPARLAAMTPKELELLIGPHLPCALPALSTRCRHLNEVGFALVSIYSSDPLLFLRGCGSSADVLVLNILSSFPSFRDSSVSSCGTVRPFYKRAQILAADLWAAFNSRPPLDLVDVDVLTTFADYRVPQLLRHLGALEYGPGLAEKVDGGEELPAGGKSELDIRAATVVAVDRLVKEVRGAGGAVEINAVKMDWLLWQRGEKMEGKGEMKPHHKVRTTFY